MSREQMPQTAAFIDSLREAFGKDEIDAQIRKGMKGGIEFYASEGGITYGTKDMREGIQVNAFPAHVHGQKARKK